MAENDCAASDEQSPANQETESPETVGLPQVVAGVGGGDEPAFTSANRSGGGAVDSGVSGRVLVAERMEKRKRGRPRKYSGDRSTAVAAGEQESRSEPSLKRGRGRPKGSGKLQLLGSAGGTMNGTAGRSFIPYVETVQPGEDVVAKILSYSQKGPRAVCVLSAIGIVSSVTISQPGSPGHPLRYEGRYEILTLSGSFTCGETAGMRCKTGLLSVSLAMSDGRVFGGAVTGALVAASPIQLVVGTFKQSSKTELGLQQKLPAESSMAAGTPLDPQATRAPMPAARTMDGEENCATPTSGLFDPNAGGGNMIAGNQNMNNAASMNSVCLSGSRALQPASGPKDMS